jgi:hypothetical protein
MKLNGALALIVFTALVVIALNADIQRHRLQRNLAELQEANAKLIAADAQLKMGCEAIQKGDADLKQSALTLAGDCEGVSKENKTLTGDVKSLLATVSQQTTSMETAAITIKGLAAACRQGKP